MNENKDQPSTDFMAMLSISLLSEFPVQFGKITEHKQEGAHVARIAESTFHNAGQYRCHDFYKPISTIIP